MTATPSFRLGTALVLLGCVSALSACGDGKAELVDASKGTPFKVSAKATFDRSQRLANLQTLKITVTNHEAHRALPDVGVVVQGLTRTISSVDNGAGRVADPRRPVWIVDSPPAGATTAYVDTWAVGPLKAGESRTFKFGLTPVVAGRHTVRWRVAAGLDVNAPVTASGGVDRGTFRVNVAG